MRVKELMTQPPSTCHMLDSANTAAKLMWEHDCGIVPVVDDDHHLVGIVTDRDICMAAYFQGRRLSDIPVESFMSRELSSCKAEDAVNQVEQLMRDRQIHRVPVVDQHGTPIGILSLTDLAREVVRNGNGRSSDADAVLSTVAAISRPRWEAR